MNKPPDLFPSALEAIGNTPLVDLARLTWDMDGRILAKLEYFNPTIAFRAAAMPYRICRCSIPNILTDI